MRLEDRIRGAVLGHAVGDALGVPVEFVDREALDKDPVSDMRGFGSHDQPPGTWSDDTSLMLCLLEVLKPDLNTTKLADKFIKWKGYGHLTAHGHVFDIGGTTRKAIDRLADKVPPEEAGGISETSNGNGSLMRILPIAFLTGLDDSGIFELAGRASSLTHRHARSLAACGIFCLIGSRLVRGDGPAEALAKGVFRAEGLLDRREFRGEREHFKRILGGGLKDLERDRIRSTGYVVDTLEAALWSLLKGRSFEETVLLAVNLGEDADTVGAVAGGLAGAWYGLEGIPSKWLEVLARKERIDRVIDRFLTKKGSS